MEDLFTTNIAVEHQNTSYRVIFENEQYTFSTEAENNAFPTFSFKRENDEWHEQQPLPARLKQEAIDALERYLLQQH